LLFPRRKPLLPEAVQAALVDRIREAESRTTGELRVFVERRCAYIEPMDRARELFAELGMASTERRNAVLVYIATHDRQFALFGDEEIYRLAGGPAFWEGAATALQVRLRGGDVAGGLFDCITLLGDALARHFPYDPAVQRNELPDEIVFGK